MDILYVVNSVVAVLTMDCGTYEGLEWVQKAFHEQQQLVLTSHKDPSK